MIVPPVCKFTATPKHTKAGCVSINTYGGGQAFITDFCRKLNRVVNVVSGTARGQIMVKCLFVVPDTIRDTIRGQIMDKCLFLVPDTTNP
ncbi:hypothetical protein ACE198_02250 [Neobacillus sp. KR4-4]|uniref:hypothetical protein n=1 Tax=Neobacillus sp. KR4-4 TaxID=3344872 RepID=UPI0035CBB20C